MRLINNNTNPLNYFTDRDDLQEDFARRLAWKPNVSSSVAVYYGMGGAGKTSLLNAVIERQLIPAKIPYAVVDFDYDTETRSVEKTFSRLRRSFGRSKLKFPTFDLIWARYFEEITGQKVSESLVPPELADVANIFSMIPGVGSIPQVLASLANISKAAVDLFVQHYKESWQQRILHMDARELLSMMPIAMARDIEEAMKSPDFRGKEGQSRITIIFDGYERLAEQNVDDWWIRDFCVECGSALKVICGRDSLEWKFINKEGVNLEHVELKNLTYEDAETYLQQRGIDDVVLRQYLVKLTDGFPYHLQLAADICVAIEDTTKQEPTIQDFVGVETTQDLGDQLLERFLRQLQYDERDAVLLAAIPRWFTQEILEVILSKPESARRLFKRLTSFSFCVPVPNILSDNKLQQKKDIPFAYTLRKEPRELLLRQARVMRNWQRWKSQLRDYHESNMDSSQEEEFLHLLEQLYHTFEIDTHSAIQLMETSFERYQEQCMWSHCSQIIETAGEYIGLNLVKAYVKFYKAEMLLWQHEFKPALNMYKESRGLQNLVNLNTLTPRTLLRMADMLKELGEIEEAISTANQSLEFSRQVKDKLGEAHALRYIAILDYKSNVHYQDLNYLETALAIFREIKNEYWIVEALRDISLIHQHCRRFAEAIQFAEEALAYAKQIGNRNAIARARHSVARTLLHDSQYDQSLEQYSIAIKDFEELGDRGGVAACNRAIGMIFRDRPQPNYKQSIDYLRKALHIDEIELRSRWGVGRIMFELARYSFKQGGNQVDLEDYRDGLEYLLTAKAIWQKIEHADADQTIALLAQVQKKLGQPLFDNLVAEIDITKGKYTSFFLDE